MSLLLPKTNSVYIIYALSLANKISSLANTSFWKIPLKGEFAWRHASAKDQYCLSCPKLIFVYLPCALIAANNLRAQSTLSFRNSPGGEIQVNGRPFAKTNIVLSSIQKFFYNNCACSFQPTHLQVLSTASVGEIPLNSWSFPKTISCPSTRQVIFLYQLCANIATNTSKRLPTLSFQNFPKHAFINWERNSYIYSYCFVNIYLCFYL